MQNNSKLNRLQYETSPYLLQHQTNPVDWYPWGQEALQKAKTENKPILLSIGYSACHWCHVMEKECFENPEIATLMNELFINIKVDREERPDLDQIYQNVAQLITRSGGWPLTVFLTPDLKPFFGGTYFPPEDRYGRPGLPRLLVSLSNAFRNEAENVQYNTEKLLNAIQEIEGTTPKEKVYPTSSLLKTSADQLIGFIDWKNGGFGASPKFPNPMNLTFLLRMGLMQSWGMAIDAVILSLEQMATRGLYDHLGGGFHRYCVDERWDVPHFEKMLYDNGLLLELYSEAYLTLPQEHRTPELDRLLKATIVQTTEYLFREMLSNENLFYSTQDADSEGVEGRFFVWSKTDIHSIFDSTEKQNLACEYFGISENGNFEHTNSSVLSILKNSTPTNEIEQIRKTLFNEREKRIKPFRDEKSILSWNSLAISGLCKAYSALQSSGENHLAEKVKEQIQKTIDAIESKFKISPEKYFSTYKDGIAKHNAYLDDYAFYCLALLKARNVVQDVKKQADYLKSATNLFQIISSQFQDERGGYFFTSIDHESLITRPKSYHDQAIPSGIAVTLECAQILNALGVSTYELENNLGSAFSMTTSGVFSLGGILNSGLLYLTGVATIEGQLSYESLPFFAFHQSSTLENNTIKLCHNQTCFEITSNQLQNRLLEIQKNSGRN